MTTFPVKPMELKGAQLLFHLLEQKLAPYCKRFEIAGSARRGKPVVKDLEIVCEPTMEWAQPSLLPDGTSNSKFWPGRIHMSSMPDLNSITKDGQKYIQFQYRNGDSLHQVDLFMANADNYGFILALRTGPAEFSRRLVTDVSKGGLKPDNYKVHDGYVWGTRDQAHTIFTDFPIPVPTELDLFALFGMDWLEPSARS